MAIVLITGNIQVNGDQGRFEADPSTWNFGGEWIVRTPDEAYEGIYSLGFLPGEDINPQYGIDGSQVIALGNVAGYSPTKNYLVRARVKVINTILPSGGSHEFKFLKPAPVAITPISETVRTITEAAAGWVEVEGLFPAGNIYDLFYLILEQNGAQTDFPVPGVYIDKFEIFEYVEVEQECTLDFDLVNCIITHETTPGANDGSITLAVTGLSGAAAVEYSKNNGSTWQSSNVFAGLGPAVYQCKARQVDFLSCVASQSFGVNAAAPSHDFTTSVTHETVLGAADGIIEVTVSGTGGPFTYSKDGGTTYQGGNVFNALAPGTYTIVVKNAAANTVAKNVTVNPGIPTFEKIFFSENPITQSAQAAAGYEAVNNYRGYCDTRVDENWLEGNFVSSLSQDQEPRSDGSMVFSIRQAFRGLLKANAPEFNSSVITRLTDRIKWFKNYMGYLEDAELVPGALVASNPYLVMLGGLNKYQFTRVNYFTSYLPTNKKFLTWAPIEKPVDPNQEDYLNFWIYSIAITELKLQIKAYFDDNTNTTAVVQTKTPVFYGELYQIPAGPSNTGVKLINPAKNIIRYELTLLDQDSVAVSETRVYNLDPISYPNKRLLLVLNSLGGFEVIRFKGKSAQEETLDRSIIEKYLPSDYTVDDHEFKTGQVSGSNSYSFSSGYFQGRYGKLWFEYMRDLLRTKSFYDVTSQERKPLVLLNSKFTGPEDGHFEYFVRIECRDPYSNESFTPDII